MTDKVYTRTGTVQSDRAPFRQYSFLINASINDNIRIQIPSTATKEDLIEAIEHLTVISNHWNDGISF